jgi:REP element-mobilizing transposase RayT
MDQPFFKAQREAELFIDVLRTNTLAGKFKLHDFVVMPDHFHVLLTVDGNTSTELAMQLIKGGYSFAEEEKIQRLKPGSLKRFTARLKARALIRTCVWPELRHLGW